jgi:hypothetical protein
MEVKPASEMLRGLAAYFLIGLILFAINYAVSSRLAASNTMFCVLLLTLAFLIAKCRSPIRLLADCGYWIFGAYFLVMFLGLVIHDVSFIGLFSALPLALSAALFVAAFANRIRGTSRRNPP